MGGKWKPEYGRHRGRRTYQGKRRGRPRKPIDPSTGLVRIYVKDQRLWETLREFCVERDWELSWTVETAVRDLMKRVQKRERSVELSEAGMTIARKDRPGNTNYTSLRKIEKRREPTTEDREAIRGWVRDYDAKLRDMADRLSAAGKRRIR